MKKIIILKFPKTKIQKKFKGKNNPKKTLKLKTFG